MNSKPKNRPQITRAGLVELTEIKDPARGTLGIAETPSHVPFDIRRVLLHYDLPLNNSRGNHAHRTLEEFIICLTGAVEVSVRDATGSQMFQLASPLRGVYVAPLTWITMTVLSPGTTCVVMTSDDYNPDEYINHTAEFEALLDQHQIGGE